MYFCILNVIGFRLQVGVELEVTRQVVFTYSAVAQDMTRHFMRGEYCTCNDALGK